MALLEIVGTLLHYAHIYGTLDRRVVHALQEAHRILGESALLPDEVSKKG